MIQPPEPASLCFSLSLSGRGNRRVDAGLFARTEARDTEESILAVEWCSIGRGGRAGPVQEDG